MRAPWLLFLLTILTVPLQAADTYRVLREYPHDPSAFTQGLIYIDGNLYESTGRNGQSSLRMVDLGTGRVLQEQDLAQTYFAEGLTDWHSTLVQLTWQSHVAFVYDRFSFRQLRTVQCPWEGWGLTHDATSLILSDGSATLHFLDPESFREVRHITVRDHGRPVTELNELEFIKTDIYANVWHTNRIARISPKTGKVLGWIDLSGLVSRVAVSDPEAVLNGIAWNPANGHLFVTGKLWPKVFEIELVPAVGPHGTHS